MIWKRKIVDLKGKENPDKLIRYGTSKKTKFFLTIFCLIEINFKLSSIEDQIEFLLICQKLLRKEPLINVKATTKNYKKLLKIIQSIKLLSIWKNF